MHLVVTVSVMQAGSATLSVRLDTIEDHPDPFLGRDVSVDAEVEEIFGPRVFTIDEPGWSDFDTEVLVIMPSEGLAIVREDDRITVTGRLLSAAEAALDEEALQIASDRRDDMAHRSVIVASRIDVHERRTAGDRPNDGHPVREALGLSRAHANSEVGHANHLLSRRSTVGGRLHDRGANATTGRERRNHPAGACRRPVRPCNGGAS
jgi:hypothetical protein